MNSYLHPLAYNIINPVYVQFLLGGNWKTFIFTIPLISSPLRIPEMIKTKYGATQSTALSKLEDQIANNRELAKALKGSVEETCSGGPSPSGSVPGESGSRTLASPDFSGAVDVPNFTTRVVLESKPIDDFYNGRTLLCLMCETIAYFHLFPIRRIPQEKKWVFLLPWSSCCEDPMCSYVGRRNCPPYLQRFQWGLVACKRWWFSRARVEGIVWIQLGHLHWSCGRTSRFSRWYQSNIACFWACFKSIWEDVVERHLK